jgi:hypothetical protein
LTFPSETGDDDDDDPDPALDPTDVYPRGMAVASPTASRDVALRRSLSMVEPPKDYNAKKELLQAILDAGTLEECASVLPLGNVVADVNCYGPGMDYAGHPDTVRRREHRFVVAPETSAAFAWDGSLPTGDLGIWGANEGDQACVAAKLNSLIDNAANRVESAFFLGAIAACVMKNSDIALPEIGDDPLDLTDDIVALLDAGQADPFTITAVSVERMADVGTDSVLHYNFELTEAMSSQVYTSDFYHQQDSDDPTVFSGVIANTLEYVAGMATQAHAYSLEYRRNGSDIEARMLSADYNTAVADATIFDGDNVLDVSGTWSGNFGQTIYHVDPDTGDGEVSYAWQAGTGDSHARVFNAYVRKEMDDVTRGCGWFGYGPRFANGDMMEDPALSDNTIERFICNWAGPGNLHDDMSQLDRAQKQCVYLDEADGLFKIDQDDMMDDINFITYAPTNSCDVGDPSDFDYNIGILAETVIDAQITNNLVTLSADDNYIEWEGSLVPTWVP